MISDGRIVLGYEFFSILVLQVTADLTPLNAKKVAVKFDFFKIAGLVSVFFFPCYLHLWRMLSTFYCIDPKFDRQLSVLKP